jgi:hypothetical protein
MRLRDLQFVVAPYRTHRRVFVDILVSGLRNPSDLPARLRWASFSTFFRYRSATFSCTVCGERSTPIFDFPNLDRCRKHGTPVLRETLQCRHCYASLRQRGLARGLLDHWYARTSVRHPSVAALARAGLGGLRIFDTDAFSAISEHLRGVSGYVCSSYRPELPWGARIDGGHFNIDLEQIDFADESFDIVLTSDVMEHVRNDVAAHRELHRVLHPGGAYIFTVPYDERMAGHRRLVDTSGPDDILLCEPHYHGDPVNGRILAYRIYGRALLAELHALGFDIEHRRIDDLPLLLVGAEVFVAVKRAGAV